jgi:hypothetical protein
MESPEYKKAYEIAKKIDSKLTAKKFTRWVRVSLADGADFLFPSAFTVENRKKWLFVFTEHYGFHIYEYNMVVGFQEFERKK